VKASLRLTVVCGAVLVVSVACGGRGDSDSTKVADSAAASPATPPVAGTYTVADFHRLLWLAGQWQGFMPDGSRFFERYRFVDDSTIAMHSYSDSTFRKATDSARITLRGGVVADQGAKARWVATRLDSTGIDFAAERGATNNFTWAREDSTKWNATLRWTDEQGRPQTVMYALHRFGR
jgi:hypothetical protein